MVQDEIRPWRFPPRLDFQYSDWWRAEFESGDLEPWPSEIDPDLAVLLTMVLLADRPLFGPPPSRAIEPVPWGDLVTATIDTVETVIDQVDDDTCNMILTLARMWCTLATGDIRPKDAAASWAVERLPGEHRPVLERARAIYLGEEDERWEDLEHAVRPHAEHVSAEIRRLADQAPSSRCAARSPRCRAPRPRGRRAARAARLRPRARLALGSSRRKRSHCRGPSTRTTRAPWHLERRRGSSRSTTSVRSLPVALLQLVESAVVDQRPWSMHQQPRAEPLDVGQVVRRQQHRHAALAVDRREELAHALLARPRRARSSARRGTASPARAAAPPSARRASAGRARAAAPACRGTGRARAARGTARGSPGSRSAGTR